MSRLQALRDALRPLGIYKLEKGTLVYAELAAYAAGLDLLEDGLDELEREAFLPTAQGEGISRREEIYGKPKTLLPLRERREMLLYRGAINNRNNTREDLERALVACGLRAQVKENLDGASIYINCFNIITNMSIRYKTNCIRILGNRLFYCFSRTLNNSIIFNFAVTHNNTFKCI